MSEVRNAVVNGITIIEYKHKKTLPSKMIEIFYKSENNIGRYFKFQNFLSLYQVK